MIAVINDVIIIVGMFEDTHSACHISIIYMYIWVLLGIVVTFLGVRKSFYCKLHLFLM